MTQKALLDNIPIPPVPDCGRTLLFYERLKCFFHRLSEVAIPTKADETLDLINSAITDVEDCHSGIEAVANPGLKTNGRMYAIREDFVDRRDNGAIVALSKSHKILIEPTGEFSILTRFDEELIIRRNHEAV